MLAYRHGFHAGSAADVFKHSVLIFCLDYLVQKEKPCLFVDTHAGAGTYRLDEGFAAQNREWENGIGRITTAFQAVFHKNTPPLLKSYLELAKTEPYPGSPALMLRFIRPGDRLVCFELHPADYLSLGDLLAPHPGTEARQADGFKGLAGLLPPPSRRGCVLIDPSYEIKEDFNTLPGVLRAALKRFAGGLYLVWYPLLAEGRPGPEDFAKTLMGLYGGNRCRVEFYTAKKDAPPANSPRGLYGSGMVIYNPPWTLKAALEESLPVLAEVLGSPDGWKLWWEVLDPQPEGKKCVI